MSCLVLVLVEFVLVNQVDSFFVHEVLSANRQPLITFHFYYNFAMDVSQIANQVLASVQTQFQTVIDNLQAQITALQAELATVRSQQVTSTPISRPRPRLPDPVKFDGKQHRFRVWLPEVKAKLAVDDEAIGNDIAKFFYVYGCLEPTVQAMVLPQLAIAEKEKKWDYNTILDQLSRAYTNPNEVFEAEEALHAIRQGDQPLSVEK